MGWWGEVRSKVRVKATPSKRPPSGPGSAGAGTVTKAPAWQNSGRRRVHHWWGAGDWPVWWTENITTNGIFGWKSNCQTSLYKWYELVNIKLNNQIIVRLWSLSNFIQSENYGEQCLEEFAVQQNRVKNDIELSLGKKLPLYLAVNLPVCKPATPCGILADLHTILSQRNHWPGTYDTTRLQFERIGSIGSGPLY